MRVVFIILLAAVVVISISIAMVYDHIPLVEMKRRARGGDKLYKSLYKVASYRFSSQFLLWFIASLASAGFFVLASIKSPVWFSLCLSLILIWVAFIWIPRSSVNILSEYLAQVFASPLAWSLHYISPTITRLRKRLFRKPKTRHTGFYESADFVELFEKQQKQIDNRVASFELNMLKRVVQFNKLKVSDIMTFKRKVKSVAVEEKLSPVVLDELYKTGHLYFPVYSGKQSEIVGTLNIFDVVEDKTTPSVASVMDRRISYVHEDQYLDDLLLTIITTRRQFFIVINSNREYVGIITTKDAIQSLVGSDISSAFDQHDSKDAVAEHFSGKSQSDEENIPKDTTEVIE